jgi:DNA polymerase-1
MRFGDGSLFMSGKQPLARKPEQIQPTGEQQKTLLQVKAKKKPGEFDIKWPALTMQQPKDYQVVTTAEALIAYLKHCEETGLCGFDYETTVTDEYRAMWAVKKREFRSELDRITYEYQDEIDAVEEPDAKKRDKAVKKIEKERDKELAAVNKAYEKAAEHDFLRAPLDPWKSEICTVSLSAAPHEARVVFIGNEGANQFIPDWTCSGGKAGRIQTNRDRVFNILNQYLFQNSK